MTEIHDFFSQVMYAYTVGCIYDILRFESTVLVTWYRVTLGLQSKTFLCFGLFSCLWKDHFFSY